MSNTPLDRTHFGSVRRRTVRIAISAVAAAMVVLLSGCGSPDITRGRIAASLPVVFSNLYVQEQAQVGHPGLTLAAVKASKVNCDRGGPTVPDTGAGSDWICFMDFTDGTGTPQPQSKFELKLTPNGCYTAGAPTKIVGPLTIKNTAGKYVTNLVFEFDGCFDTTR